MEYEMESRARELAAGLLAWYDENKRDLPWRRTREPYPIWVCEIMAQQTRISFLLAHYERFIRRFPTVQSLARAGEADVLKAWEGLGYYSRAVNLQKAAKEVVSRFDGELPRTREELLTLPGIGPYTAGAILSMAYNIPAAAVDGNVLRVFSHLECWEGDIQQAAAKRAATDFVLSAMPRDQAGSFTQALMELGALVCRPANPDCPACPLSARCKARISGRQNKLPNRAPRAAVKLQRKTVIILRDPKGRVLMRRRTERLLSGLWEFYLAEGSLNRTRVRALLQAMGHTPADIKELGSSRHLFTHLAWQMRGYDCQSDTSCLPGGYQWIDEVGVKALALPAALRFYTKQAFPG